MSLFFYWLTEGRREEYPSPHQTLEKTTLAPCIAEPHDGFATKTNQLVCLAPGCDFLTPSEDTLNNHYSCHFGRLSSSSDHQTPYPYPLDHDELYINHLVRELRAKNHPLDTWTSAKIEVVSSPSLLRKLLRSHKNGPKGLVTLSHVGLQRVIFRTWGEIPGRSSNYLGAIQLNFHASVHTDNVEPLPFAFLYTFLGLNDSCHCACCVPKTLIEGLESGFTLQHSMYKHSWQGSLTLALRQHLFVGDLYCCDASGCTHKCKRWADLERHASTSHCLNAKKFPCKYPGCERGGDNGFPRKDKLKSHFENVHRGVGIPPKQPRALVPKK